MPCVAEVIGGWLLTRIIVGDERHEYPIKASIGCWFLGRYPHRDVRSVAVTRLMAIESARLCRAKRLLYCSPELNDPGTIDKVKKIEGRLPGRKLKNARRISIQPKKIAFLDLAPVPRIP